MELPLVLSLISTTALVVGGVFAGYQVRNATRARAREAQLLFVRSYQTPDFMRALDCVIELPDGLSKYDLEQRGPETMERVGFWLGSMESIGVLVHNGEISLDMAADFFSGPIIVSWRKLEQYVTERRRELGRGTMHEYFQWLAERLTH